MGHKINLSSRIFRKSLIISNSNSWRVLSFTIIWVSFLIFYILPVSHIHLLPAQHLIHLALLPQLPYFFLSHILSSFFMHHIRPDSSCPVHQIHALNISQFLLLYVYPMERFSFLTFQLPTMHILHIPILSASISPFFLFKSNFPVLRSPILVYSLCIYKLYSSV